MKKKYTLGLIAFAGLVTLVLSCVKDSSKSTPATPFPAPAPVASFVEEFDSVGNLTAKGWVFRNNSIPNGQTGWRQGRYESMPLSTPATKKGGFTGPVPFLGFPAFSATNSPQDFVSVDITALNDPNGTGGNISAWLISPKVAMRNGDKISFYTRAVDDQFYPERTRDRMQVWLNTADGSANVGTDWESTGSFSMKVLDINQNYVNNRTGGYPETWRKYIITLAGLPTTGVSNARFAFRYYGEDAGFFGGSGGTNYPSLIGIDSLSFVHN
ncbi:MAG: hypothetical protein JWP69_1834 [Flaviaesturariibacter sp.]|nr:hypothetical protein [Flaviaesturariibacter sp.]